VEKEAEKMGRTWSAGVADAELSVRPSVPRSSQEFARQRNSFRRGLGELRKTFAGEWEARRRVEAAAAAAIAAREEALKAERNDVRRVQRSVALEAQAEQVKGLQAAREARRAVAASSAGKGQTRYAELRRVWLAELEEDAKTWITPERIDTMITPALFAAKFSWQWEDWFSARELKRQLREDARRSHRGDAPRSEVVLPPSLVPYAENWESDEEGEDGGAPANAEAASHASPAIALALAAAREAGRARGQTFAEPGYGPDGRALPLPDSLKDVAATRMAEARRAGGVSLVELAAGKPLEDVLREYETWLEAQAASLEAALKEQEEREAEKRLAAVEEAAAAAAAATAAAAAAAAAAGGISGSGEVRFAPPFFFFLWQPPFSLPVFFLFSLSLSLSHDNSSHYTHHAQTPPLPLPLRPKRPPLPVPRPADWVEERGF
jgi:hypothetical protein